MGTFWLISVFQSRYGPTVLFYLFSRSDSLFVLAAYTRVPRDSDKYVVAYCVAELVIQPQRPSDQPTVRSRPLICQPASEVHSLLLERRAFLLQRCLFANIFCIAWWWRRRSRTAQGPTDNAVRRPCYIYMLARHSSRHKAVTRRWICNFPEDEYYICNVRPNRQVRCNW